MERRPIPSRSEWQVFVCLCRYGPSTLSDLVPRLTIKRYTISTLLLRLAEKGYASEPDHRGRYRALVPFAQALDEQIDRFLEIFVGTNREACSQLIRRAEKHGKDLEP